MILLAGPCVIESRDLVMRMAEKLAKIAQKSGADYYFKSSFDKANRTSISSFRGPGLDEGLKILAEVKANFGLKIVTDIHESHQAAPAAQVCDMLQIPAFLCRQTDLLVAAAKTKAIVNIKKGQFLAPAAMKHSVIKVLEARGVYSSVGDDKNANSDSAKNQNRASLDAAAADSAKSQNLRDLARQNGVYLCERGSTFGYGNLVVDMRSLVIMREFAPVIFDATHSVQMPASSGAASGGDARFVRYLARAAAAVGVDGFFYETHERPCEALCDGPNMLDLAEFEASLDEVGAIMEMNFNKEQK